MATRSRAGIDARLAELENRRDQLIDRMTNRYFDRVDALIAPERRPEIQREGDFNDAERAMLRADPEIRRIDAAYTRLAGWRSLVWDLMGKRASGDES